MLVAVKKICVVISLLVVSQMSMAADAQNQEKIEAKSIISQYKQLRSLCLKSHGAEKKACFAKLEAANSSYIFAKRVLSLSSTDKKNQQNIHLVSFL